MRQSKGKIEGATAPRGNRRRASIEPAPFDAELVSEPREHSRPTFAVRMTLLRERTRGWLGRGKDLSRRAGRVLVGAAVLGVAVFSGRAIEAHARTSPTFALKDVEVLGNAQLSRALVLGAAGVGPGMNAFALAPEVMEQRLLQQPWIRSAEVERRLPSTLRIEVQERVPAAVLSFDDTSYLVSTEGEVIKQLSGADPADFPVITGVDRTRFTADTNYRHAILSSVVSCLDDYRLSGLERREPVQEINVGAGDSVALYVGKDATLVRLGKGPFRRKLRLLRSVLDRLARDRARPAYVYLDNERNPGRVTLRIR